MIASERAVVSMCERAVNRLHDLIAHSFVCAFTNRPYRKDERHLLPRAPFFCEIENLRVTFDATAVCRLQCGITDQEHGIVRVIMSMRAIESIIRNTESLLEQDAKQLDTGRSLCRDRDLLACQIFPIVLTKEQYRICFAFYGNAIIEAFEIVR